MPSRPGSADHQRAGAAGAPTGLHATGDPSADLRSGQAALVADATTGGLAFGEAYADLLDDVLSRLLVAAGTPSSVAIVALGSYARRELCPGSDVDVLLVHKGLPRGVADSIWYPLWDAGVVV